MVAGLLPDWIKQLRSEAIYRDLGGRAPRVQTTMKILHIGGRTGVRHVAVATAPNNYTTYMGYLSTPKLKKIKVASATSMLNNRNIRKGQTYFTIIIIANRTIKRQIVIFTNCFYFI